jgi:catechol 2,3-dioxygenase-like lactoylglutathione lyase family enzyme
MTSPHETVNVRYMVDDVQAAVDFYTDHLVRSSAVPAFADVSRGNLRLLLVGPASSAAASRLIAVSGGPLPH